MTTLDGPTIFKVTSILMIVLGLFGFFIRPHFIQTIININIMAQGIFLFFIATSKSTSLAVNSSVINPTPHAMVLTGIVVAVCSTAFSLYLARILYELKNKTSLAEDKIQKHGKIKNRSQEDVL